MSYEEEDTCTLSVHVCMYLYKSISIYSYAVI